MYDVLMAVLLLGTWSGVGVTYRNTRRANLQLEDIVKRLDQLAGRAPAAGSSPTDVSS
jgi:hypothetical protein